jgi:hypothetical protein
MTLSLALALNGVADVALLGGLAWFMTRPTRLNHHVSARHGARRLVIVPAESAQEEHQDRVAA